MQTEPKPILSRMQIGPGEGPEMYFPAPGSNSDLTRLYTRFIWHHHDMCLFHQAVCGHLQQRNKRLYDIVADYEQRIEKFKNANLDSDSDEYEWVQIMFARAREHMRVLEMEYESLRSFGDQHVVIGLWAIVEQYCGRVLIALEKHQGIGSGMESPHQFQQLERRFAAVSISIRNCKGYGGIDECRVVNNKIKHVGLVDDHLARYPHFAGMNGKDLNELELPMQFYSDSVYEFVGHVMEIAGKVISGTDL